MSASLPTDQRPVPTVAIIGNDAVLAAAPATPVQLAHACLRRGFAVAVPASWGDELIAAEAVRRLAAREKGPAVMCVCPYVRSRLLAPGPDLAPFLVSLLPPPVAAARYLRTLYGERGVRITYIGGCPGADDPAIDTRLTPAAFLADIAEYGISLSEQPLVFDSIVPPDRRRWCSLPGGVPSAEVLWSESDTRTLIEIDPDDASTDLAQHIITHEHVLLDLAPGLGCACSGAIASMPARSARVAVTAIEPPRALAPVVDPAVVVSLDAPVGVAASTVRPGAMSPRDAAPPAESPVDVGGPPSAESLPAVAAPPAVDTVAPAQRVEPEVAAIRTSAASEQRVEAHAGPMLEPVIEPAVHSPTSETPDASSEETRVALEHRHGAAEGGVLEAPAESARASAAQPDTAPTAPAAEPLDTSPVRRRTPQAMPARPVAGSIPRAAGGDGRSLPRAYIGKRRTPAAGAPRVPEAPRPTTPPAAAAPRAEADASSQPPGAPVPPSAAGGTAAPSPAPPRAAVTPPAVRAPVADAESRGGSLARSVGDHGALVFLLAGALLALGVYVLSALRR